MKFSTIFLMIGLGTGVMVGAGCSDNRISSIPVPVVSIASVTSTASPLPPSDQGPALEERVDSLLVDAPLMADATSSDALNGPLQWTPNHDFIVGIASESVRTWLERDVESIASPDNFCIGKEFQSPSVFKEKILSQFKPDDRVYVYAFAPDPKKNPHQKGYWDMTILPNRFGYTSANAIDNAFAWVGGCEAGSVGLHAFNEHWIAYGDGCHESGGPSLDLGCHAAIDALGYTVKLR